MKHYKFDKKDGLIDETGKHILQIVKCDCSEKFRIMAGKELANKLNTIEQSKITLRTPRRRNKRNNE